MNNHSNPLAEPLRELLAALEQFDDEIVPVDSRGFARAERVMEAAKEAASYALRAADLADAEQKRKSA